MAWRRLVAVVLSCPLFFAYGVAHAASSPMAQLSETVDEGLAIIRNKALSEAEQKVLLWGTIANRIDFREFAMRALGNHWNSYSDRHDEYVIEFRGLLERIYFSQTGTLSDATVEYEKEIIDGEFASVHIRAVRVKGDIPLIFRMHRTGKEWRVYDFSIEGISIVSNYRTQFNRVIQMESFDELLRRLRGTSHILSGR